MTKRLVLLVARTDETDTLVVAAWEEGILYALDYEVGERIKENARQTWCPDAWEWREVRVDLNDDQILAAFVPPVVAGEIVEPSPLSQPGNTQP